MSQCVEGYCHLNASSSRRTWHGHDHPSLDPLRTSDGQRQRLSITPAVRAFEVVFVQRGLTEAGLSLPQEKRERIGRRNEEVKRRPVYVSLLVDLQCQCLCQIKRVLAANDGFRAGAACGARDQ